MSERVSYAFEIMQPSFCLVRDVALNVNQGGRDSQTERLSQKCEARRPTVSIRSFKKDPQKLRSPSVENPQLTNPSL